MELCLLFDEARHPVAYVHGRISEGGSLYALQNIHTSLLCGMGCTDTSSIRSVLLVSEEGVSHGPVFYSFPLL